MNGVPIPDLLDYVIDVAGHIVELQLKTNKIVTQSFFLKKIGGVSQPRRSFGSSKSAIKHRFQPNREEFLSPSY